MKILKLLFIVVTVIAVIGQVENWRGRARWEAARATLLEHGYSLDWRDYYPATPAESENAAFHPAFAKLFRFREDGSKILDFTTHYDLLDGIPSERPLDESDTDFLETTAAMGDLAALWGDAFSRPHCVWFPFDVHAPDEFPLIPTVGNVTSLANKYAPLYRQRALAHLRLGDPETARREWVASLDFFHSFAEEPSFVGLLVDLALCSIALPGCEEVIATEGWREEDLAHFQETFAAMKFLDRADAGMHLELVTELHMMEALMNNEKWVTEQSEQLGHRRWMRHLPKGWWYQNFATTVDHMQGTAFDWYDRDRRILKQGDADAIPSSEERKRNQYHPYRCIAQIVTPTIGNILGIAASNESTAELLELYCAARRFQLAEGSYPERLEDLIPGFIDKLPINRTTGAAVEYENKGFVFELRSDDQSFTHPIPNPEDDAPSSP